MMTAFFSSEFFSNYRRNASAIAGSLILVCFVVIVLFGPFLVAQDPYDIAALDLMDSYKPPAWLPGGDPRFLLGTDGQGRDVLAAIFYGTRISVMIGVTAMVCSLMIGTFVGLLAGYFGGRVGCIHDAGGRHTAVLSVHVDRFVPDVRIRHRHRTRF
ncbi:ABC transporter permease [Roseibium alexandrii]|uniref:ABC transporter permease n=1 Tax=Roseibium alexandrii TaxID=388408 RepID=UPI0037501447